MSAAADTQQNLIGGEGLAARSGSHFDVPAAAGPSSWPRSDRTDLESALASLRSGLGPWGGMDRSGRLSILNTAWADFTGGPDPGGALASRFGLSQAECRETLLGADAQPALDPDVLSSRFEGGSDPAEGTVIFIRLHWSELFKDLFVCVAAELLAGRCVLLVSDPRVPGLAQGLADLLLGAGLPPDALALLHDDGETVLRAALVSPWVGGFVVSGFEHQELPDERGSGGGFGEGIVERASTAWSFRLLAPCTLCVGVDADPRLAARRVAGELFSRLPSLSGQLPGMPSIVEVPPRLFSAFTTELLLALEAPEGESASDAYPCPWVDGALATYLEQTLTDGIDGGATLIHEERRPSFSGDPASGTILRLVFTNVEREMRLLEQVRPAPVVLLRRGDPDSTSTHSTA
ncbi:MAG: hypothetical protein QGI93_08545 [Planctomycetota bacterium]|nr:hypothetical protein [Planctomycetota bacterium]